LLKEALDVNTFDQKLNTCGHYPLIAKDVSTLQVNVGYKCNLRCTHCHVEASPDRTEEMSLNTMSALLSILRENSEMHTVDITGGSPELNNHFKHFVISCADTGKKVIVRTNLAIYAEPEMEGMHEFLRENRVKLVASMPCYTEEGVDSQRGKGTYKKAIDALKKLNSLGYGKEGTGLEIDIMFNPAKADIAPDQLMLEKAYKEKLMEMHGITFNNLIALSNMPIGRLGKSTTSNEYVEYTKKLVQKFNPETVENLMCRHLISVSPDGTLFDCDFWQMLKLPVRSKESNDVKSFNYMTLSNRQIVTNPMCFMCTAGAGASCGGALA
jgi:radical SAM/Cys-rich protein